MSRRPAEWIKQLDAGEYLIKDLVKLTSLSPSNIRYQLLKHGAKKKPSKKYYKNLTTYIYIWKGYIGD